MKTTLFFFLLVANTAFGQNRQQILQDFKANAPMYISLANLGLSAVKVDPAITNLIDDVVPKIIDENIDGAVDDVLDLLRKKTGIQVLEPSIKIYLTSKFRTSTDLIVRQDYPQLVLTICDFALVTDNFIKHRTVPTQANINSNIAADKTIDKSTITNQNPPVKPGSSYANNGSYNGATVLKLVNNTDALLDVSFAYYDKGDNCIVSRGWRKIEAHGTNDIDLTNLNMANAEIYLHGENKAHDLWGGDNYFCANYGSAFRILNNEQNTQGKKVRYRKISLQQGENSYEFHR